MVGVMSGQLHVAPMRALQKALGCDARDYRGWRLEQLLLLLFKSCPNHLFSRDELVDWLYGGDREGGAEWAESCLQVTIYRLRKKGHDIQPVFGQGYRFRPPCSVQQDAATSPMGA